MDAEIIRKPHAALDLLSRHAKARKIEHLLHLSECRGNISILEIGTGAGGIASYFGTHPDMRYAVTAVDVVDNRQIFDGYDYLQVAGVALPFQDQAFDVVISNHVIEHVGDHSFQQEHLREIRRVLKLGGQGYLAVPNRWMLTEPHYKVKFLSWLPRNWRSPYLRMTGKGNFYDCEPLEMKELEKMLTASGLGFSNLCVEAVHHVIRTENPDGFVARLLRRMPDKMIEWTRGIIPTLIYRVYRD